MTSRILVDRQLPEGAAVARFVNKVMDILAEGQRLQARLGSMSTNDDWHQVAIELGLPDPVVVSGNTNAADAWSIIFTAMSMIDSPQVKELKRLDQGS